MPVQDAEIADMLDQTDELLEIGGNNPFRSRSVGELRRMLKERRPRWRAMDELDAALRRRNLSRLKIPHNALIFVGDGRKALFLRNEGDERFPNLRTEMVLRDDNPPTHEQGSEGPGRVSKAMQSGQKSAVEAVDWHQLEEHRFVQNVATAFERMVRSQQAKALVVVAPPRALADLRDAFHDDVKACVVAELHKDLTKHSVGEIRGI